MFVSTGPSETLRQRQPRLQQRTGVLRAVEDPFGSLPGATLGALMQAANMSRCGGGRGRGGVASGEAGDARSTHTAATPLPVALACTPTRRLPPRLPPPAG